MESEVRRSSPFQFIQKAMAAAATAQKAGAEQAYAEEDVRSAYFHAIHP